MYRGAGADCPACGGALAPLRATLPMSACASCGGVWLGPDATVHVMRGLGDAVERELAQLSGAVPVAHDARPAHDSGARHCPWCQQGMSRLAVAEVMVDSCAAHGSWFDRNEVDGVVTACHRLRKKYLGLSTGETSASGLVVSAATAARDALMSVVDALLRSRGT